jgi:hypothetical protein
MAGPDDLPAEPPRRVERTGIALVHEGERIFAPEPATALLTPEGDKVVNYYFPVEIEVLGLGTAEAMAERIYEALQREFSALG